LEEIKAKFEKTKALSLRSVYSDWGEGGAAGDTARSTSAIHMGCQRRSGRNVESHSQRPEG